MNQLSRRDFMQGALAFGALGTTSVLAEEQHTGVVLINGKIATLDRSKPWIEALRIEGDRIVTVGSSRDMLAGKTSSDRVIDLRGRTAIPGLNDSHMHFVRGSLSYNVDTRWDGVPTLKQALAKLSNQAARTPQGQWVRVGGGFSEFQFAEKRMPTLAELNAAVPDKPAYVLHFYQSAMVNRKGLEVLGYTRNTPNPAGGIYGARQDRNSNGIVDSAPFPDGDPGTRERDA